MRRKTGDPSGARAYLARGRVRVVTVSDGGESAQVMVGSVRGPEHLELIRRAGFYHVPTSAMAASRTAVAFIAVTFLTMSAFLLSDPLNCRNCINHRIS